MLLPIGIPNLISNLTFNEGIQDVWPMYENGGPIVHNINSEQYYASPANSPIWQSTIYGNALNTNSGNYWSVTSRTYQASNNFTILIAGCLFGMPIGGQSLICIRNPSTFQPWAMLSVSSASENQHLTGQTYNGSSAEYNAVTGLDFIQGLPFVAAIIGTPTAMTILMWDRVRLLRQFVLPETVTSGSVTGSLFIGADVFSPSSRYWPGWLYAPRLYNNRALSTQEFLDYAFNVFIGLEYTEAPKYWLFKSSITPPPPPPNLLGTPHVWDWKHTAPLPPNLEGSPKSWFWKPTPPLPPNLEGTPKAWFLKPPSLPPNLIGLPKSWNWKHTYPPSPPPNLEGTPKIWVWTGSRFVQYNVSEGWLGSA